VDNEDLAGTEIVVAVCGGIAAYKVCTVVSRLVQRGAGVSVMMTGAARRFVGKQTFQALSGRSVQTSLWQPPPSHTPRHLDLTEAADLMLIAPATANTIGKIAAGVGDDLLSTTVLGAACPVVLAPAMNTRMWENPIVQRNVEALRELGYRFIEPGTGWQACRTTGTGRMAEPDDILAEIDRILSSSSSSST
jgi:phosphopantothenoylcysteine decarboxylase/phosphopantothenate--cysteine ligase